MWAKKYICKKYTMAITFFIQSKKDPASIYIRVREGKEIDAKTNTGLKVIQSRFSKGKIKLFTIPSRSSAETKEKLKEDNIDLIKLQEDLDRIKTLVVHKLNNRNDYETVNSDWLKKILHPEKNNEVTNVLSEYFDYYKDFKSSTLESSTLKQLSVFGNRVKKYEAKFGVVYIQDVNRKFSISFQRWMDQSGFDHNTKVNTLKKIKTICNHAKSNSVLVHPEMEFITEGLRYKKSEHVYLNFDEIKKIVELNIEDEVLNNARDWLVISCYTAQRVSDFLKFKKENVSKMNEGYFLDVIQEKTGKQVLIPLLDEVLGVLDKREGCFPPVFSKNIDSNKTIYNKLIKEVCRLAGINEVVTVKLRCKETNRYKVVDVPKYKAVSTHIGRRSFATNYYGKINTSLLIDATGHSSERQFLEYVGKRGNQNAFTLAEEMKKLAREEKSVIMKVINVKKAN